MHMQLKNLGGSTCWKGNLPRMSHNSPANTSVGVTKPIVNLIRCVGNVSGSYSTAKLSGLVTHGVHELAYQVVASFSSSYFSGPLWDPSRLFWSCLLKLWFRLRAVPSGGSVWRGFVSRRPILVSHWIIGWVVRVPPPPLEGSSEWVRQIPLRLIERTVKPVTPWHFGREGPDEDGERESE